MSAIIAGTIFFLAAWIASGIIIGEYIAYVTPDAQKRKAYKQ